MMLPYLKTLMMSVWLVFHVTLFSQQPVFRHYTTEDGLPSSETYCVTQDEKGYMWFGTDRGLARFNGYNFKVYTSGQSGLQDNTIFGLYRDHKGRMWYQSFLGNFGYWQSDSFYTYPYQKRLKSMMQSRRIENMSIDRNDCVIASWKDFSGSFNAYRIDSKGNMSGIYCDPLSPTRDIYLSENGTTITVSHINAVTSRIVSQENHKLVYTFPCKKDNNNSAIVRRRKNGDLLVYNWPEIWLVGPQGAKKLLKCKSHVLHMMVDSDDNLWLGYMNRGMEMYRKEDGYTKPATMLEQYSISGMTQDREGGLWFTTLENGIFYLPPDYIISYGGQESGLPVSKTLRIEKTEKQLLFVLSDLTLAEKYLNSNKIHKLQGLYGILDVGYRPGGPLYMGMTNGLRPPAHKHYFPFPAQRIHTGKYDVWGYIQANIFKLVPRRDVFFETISMNHIAKVSALLETGKNELLIGTVNGLYKYSGGQITSLKSVHPFFTRRISDIIQLDEHHIAFASIGHGVMILEKDNYGKYIWYTEKQGLPSDMCNVLYGPGNGTLLVGTNKGIAMIDHANNAGKPLIYIADVNRGLISNEVNDIELVGNDLWIATAKGLSVMPLQQLRKTAEILFLNMERIRVNDQVIKPQTQHLFPYRMNNMHFTFTGINYQFASKLLYKYRLKGSDDRWNISSERSVIYNSLLPGKYVFEVVLIDANGHETVNMIRYYFSISPPFWNTWWFITLLLIGVTWIIYLLFVRRIRFIRAQAQVQNDLNIYRDKALRAQMNPHFLYNSMNAIQNYIQKHETRASINYLSAFSRLMRMTFANSGEKEIQLSKDLEAVVLYMEMENLRFSGYFKLHVTYGPEVNPSRIMVPPFLIQPFVENAILHGFRPKEIEGNIWIHIEQEADRIRISIRDDGMGRDITLEAGKRKQAYLMGQHHESSGIVVTWKRLQQAWGNRFTENMFVITDLFSTENTPTGTLIEFYLPLIKL